MDGFLKFGPWTLFVGVVSILGFNVFNTLIFDEKIVRLDINEPIFLKETLFGGIPATIICSDSRKATSNRIETNEVLHPAFTGAQKYVINTMKNKLPFRFATLDCSKTLPSGKTT